MEAKAALQELNFSSDEEAGSHTDIFEDTDSDSNTSNISQMMQTPTPLDS